MRAPRLRAPQPGRSSSLRGWVGAALHRGFDWTSMSEERTERIRITEEYRGLTGMERYCREESGRSGPASVWRVYAFLWSREGEASGSISAICKGTHLNVQDAGHAIETLWDRGVVDFSE